jgi:hypothetical protein
LPSLEHHTYSEDDEEEGGWNKKKKILFMKMAKVGKKVKNNK